MIPIIIGSVIVAFLSGAALGVSWSLRRQRLAQRRAEDIIATAQRDAERIYHEKLLEAQKKAQELVEREEAKLRRREQELAAMEERLIQREDRLGKKSNYLEMIEDSLRKDEAEIRRILERGRKLLEEEERLLERLSGMSREEAKEYLLKLVEADAEKHFAQRIAAVEERYRRRPKGWPRRSWPPPSSGTPLPTPRRPRSPLCPFPPRSSRGGSSAARAVTSAPSRPSPGWMSWWTTHRM